MKRICIIEDDRELSRGIALALGQEDRTFLRCGTLEEGWREAGEADLVILDVNLPDGSGFDFLRRLRRESAVPVLMLTARDLETDQVTGLELGADDYVTKPFSLAVLRARVNTLLRRTGGGPPAAVELGPYRFDFAALRFTREGEAVELSRTEQRLLRLLVENRGRTLTRQQLLEQVWDRGEFVDENALSVAIRRLRGKLGDAPIRTVYGVGYAWQEERE